jgi:polar amino acid transport system substrate-binding protein
MAIIVAFILLASFGVFAADKGTLKVGTDATYPPFEFRDNKTNEFKGFSMDLIKAIAAKMGYKIRLVNSSWDGIITGLINGNYDCIISSMTITEDRKKAVNFSNSYFTAGQVLVVRKNDKSIKSSKDLNGKIVSVQINTTGDYAARKIKDLKDIKRFDTTPGALVDLDSGNSDASIVDEPLALWFIQKYPKLTIVGKRFTSEEYGIAVNKKNAKLLAQINKALADVKKSGEYKKIYDTWFGSNGKVSNSK